MMNAQTPVDANNSKHLSQGSQPDCSAIQALIPDYAFGLTDETETQWIESQLDQCVEAVAILADFQQMQAIMRADVPQMAPPPQLGQRLMAMAATTIPTVVPITVNEPPEPTAPPLHQSEPVAYLKIVPPTSGKQARSNRLLGLLAVAVALLVVSNAYWLVRLNMATAANEATPSPSTTAAAANAGLVVNTTSTLRWVHLPASQQSGKASAYLMWNAESKIGLLYVHDFPVLAAGQTYQLWLTRGAAHLSVGTFTVDQNGKGALLFSTESIDQYTWARITTEPQSGSDIPDGTVVVVGQL
jgi:anti-sigma-K factor RskA